MKKMMTIIGNVASGKSTLLKVLTAALDADAVDADNLFQEKDPFAKPYLADMQRWALANELWLTAQRAKILREAKPQKEDALILVDSGLLMSWVYTHSHLLVGNLNDDEWHLYKTLYDELTSEMFGNTWVIRLKYSMDTLMKRLKKRGRDYELAFYTREYLGQIEMGLNALEEKLKTRGVNVITIDESLIADFEYNESDAAKVIETVRKALK